MNHHRMLGIVSAIVIAGAGQVALAADGAKGRDAAQAAATPAASAPAASPATSIDLTGDWSLDPKRSDAPSVGPGGREIGRASCRERV